MSVATATRSLATPIRRAGIASPITETAALARRILIRSLRSPEELAASTSTPIIFVLLFRFVFGGAINVGHTGYANFLMAGIFVQAITFTALSAGTGVAQDLQSGLIDRFRSLPISQAAVIGGRVLATLVRGTITLALVIAVGLAVGFRPSGTPSAWALAVALLLVFAFALSWVGISLALVVRNAEAVQNLMMTLVFPLTFLSSAFVPAATMPGWLRLFVSHQPITQVVDAVRALGLAQPVGQEAWLTLVWSGGIVAVFAPLAVFAYRSAAAR